MITYSFTRHAEAQLREFPVTVQRRIVHKIKWFLASDDPLYFAEPLEGYSGHAYRFRIGDYRAIFERDGDTLLVTQVGHRREIYR